MKSVNFDWGFFACVLSWAAIEIPRYLYHASSIFDVSPFLLTRIYYNLFLILYPIEICCEIYCIVIMRNHTNPFILAYRMPNRINFEISYQMILTIVPFIYIPCALMFYIDMMKQRKKYSKNNNEKNNNNKRKKNSKNNNENNDNKRKKE